MISVQERNPEEIADTKSEISLALFEIGAVKFGEFKLKSGKESPFYIDLRLLISHPNVLRSVAKAYSQMLANLKFERIAAVPYAAIPIATAVSLETNLPVIYLRKETKEYGLRKPIEGEFSAGETVVVLDDLVTTGASKIETITPLKEAGLIVEDIVVLIDREQGAKEDLQKQGYKLYSFVGIRQVFEILLRHGKISSKTFLECMSYLHNEQSRA